ncbi:hypothetical protein ACMWQW_30530, partial [Escherichia coli]
TVDYEKRSASSSATNLVQLFEQVLFRDWTKSFSHRFERIYASSEGLSEKEKGWQIARPKGLCKVAQKVCLARSPSTVN